MMRRALASGSRWTGRPIPGYVLHHVFLAITSRATLERDGALRTAFAAIVETESAPTGDVLGAETQEVGIDSEPEPASAIDELPLDESDEVQEIGATEPKIETATADPEPPVESEQGNDTDTPAEPDAPPESSEEPSTE